MIVEAIEAFYSEATGAVQPWRDIEVSDDVGNGLIDEGLVRAIGGGGGGGVFSSANVTLVLDGEIILYDAFYIVDGVLTHYDDIPISTSQVLVMPLTNGSINLGLVNEMPGKELTVSGAATYDGEEDLTITGDCTITLGGK